MFRILHLSSKGSPRTEATLIRQSLNSVIHGIDFRTSVASPQEIYQGLTELKPDIVHISGDINTQGKLGPPRGVSVERLQELLQGDSLPKLTILNWSHSDHEQQGQSPVIAYNSGVRSRDSILFMQALYHSLAGGASVTDAYSAARTTAELAGKDFPHLRGSPNEGASIPRRTVAASFLFQHRQFAIPVLMILGVSAVMVTRKFTNSADVLTLPAGSEPDELLAIAAALILAASFLGMQYLQGRRSPQRVKFERLRRQLEIDQRLPPEFNQLALPGFEIDEIPFRRRELHREVSDSVEGDEDARAVSSEPRVVPSAEEHLSNALYQARDRLLETTKSLERRGNLNLIIGGAFAVAGMSVLAILSFEARPDSGEWERDLLVHYGPRFSLTVLIEILAIFFLRLYKSSLSEVRYSQNEITNVEIRLSAAVAGLTMPVANNQGCAATAILSLVETDRNAKRAEVTRGTPSD